MPLSRKMPAGSPLSSIFLESKFSSSILASFWFLNRLLCGCYICRVRIGANLDRNFVFLEVLSALCYFVVLGIENAVVALALLATQTILISILNSKLVIVLIGKAN